MGSSLFIYYNKNKLMLVNKSVKLGSYNIKENIIKQTNSFSIMVNPPQILSSLPKLYLPSAYCITEGLNRTTLHISYLSRISCLMPIILCLIPRCSNQAILPDLHLRLIHWWNMIVFDIFVFVMSQLFLQHLIFIFDLF